MQADSLTNDANYRELLEAAEAVAEAKHRLALAKLAADEAEGGAVALALEHGAKSMSAAEQVARIDRGVIEKKHEVAMLSFRHDLAEAKERALLSCVRLREIASRGK